MEEALHASLIERGLPSWLAPDALVCVGLAAFVGGFLVLRQSKRDGAPLDRESIALALLFVGAWLGAALLERAWHVPTWIATGEAPATREVDRNFYGALLGGSAAAIAYLWWRRVPVAAFLDRSVWLWGCIVVGTRLGCFLEGCCFGHPTASALGLRFPPNAPVANAHADAGWVPADAWSLPVHASQLYEAALGIVATVIALVFRRRSRRAGAAFLAWVATYALGRLWLETIRASVIASPVPWLSRAQLVSVLALVAIAAISARAIAPRPAHRP